MSTAQLRSEEPARRRRKQGRPCMTPIRVGRVEEPRSDWRRAVVAVSERRIAQGRALGSEEHLPLGLPALQVPVGIGRLHQREVAVNAQAQHARTHPGQHVPGPRQ